MQVVDESIFGEGAGNEDEKCFRKNQGTGTRNIRKKYETDFFGKLLIFIETRYFSHKINPDQSFPFIPFSQFPSPTFNRSTHLRKVKASLANNKKKRSPFSLNITYTNFQSTHYCKSICIYIRIKL